MYNHHSSTTTTLQINHVSTSHDLIEPQKNQEEEEGLQNQLHQNRSEQIQQHLPLMAAMISQIEQNLQSMHMPGHCGNTQINPIMSQNLKKYGGAFDSTTDSDFGNLGNFFPPSGSVEKCINNVTSIYGTKKTLFSLNGSTGSLLAMARLLGGQTKVVLLQRNSHRSVIHGFRLTGADIQFVMPQFDPSYDVFLPITKNDIEQAYSINPSINVICITSPTYEGLSANIKEIASFCKQRDIRLLIDGAHGSLFSFAPNLFPPSGINEPGVDILTQSTHKAAGAFSQTSLCHLIKGSSINEFSFQTALWLSSSTSPTTLLLCSIEETTYQLNQESGKELLQKTVYHAQKLKSQLKAHDRVEVLEHQNFQADPTKICFKVKGYTGEQIRTHLKDKYKIDPEYSNSKCVLISCHIGVKKITYETFMNAINELKVSSQNDEDLCYKTISKPDLPTPIYKCPISECFNKQFESIKIRDAVGRINLTIKSPCPPGCIVIDIGELIQESHIYLFDQWNMLDEYINVCL